MDLSKAKTILELPLEYTDEILKKNYKRLAMKYHPDKNKLSGDKFAEINQAYDYICKGNHEPTFEHVDNLFSTMFKNFTVNFAFPQPKMNKPLQKSEINITLTAREYLEGTTKNVSTKDRCSCEQKMCEQCAGCGFSLKPSILPFTPLDACMNCLGEGYTQSCSNCQGGCIDKNINIHIAPNIKNFEIFHPSVGVLKIHLAEPYFYRDNTLYCRFDISLKESLTGFQKIFKDPFDVEHDVHVTNIVKSNDGYQLNGIVLVFNVVYPKKINQTVIEELKKLAF